MEMFPVLVLSCRAVACVLPARRRLRRAVLGGKQGSARWSHPSHPIP